MAKESALQALRRLLASSYLTLYLERTMILTVEVGSVLIKANRMYGKKSCAALMTVATNSNKISPISRDSTLTWKMTSSCLMRKSALVIRKSNVSAS